MSPNPSSMLAETPNAVAGLEEHTRYPHEDAHSVSTGKQVSGVIAEGEERDNDQQDGRGDDPGNADTAWLTFGLAAHRRTRSDAFDVLSHHQ